MGKRKDWKMRSTLLAAVAVLVLVLLISSVQATDKMLVDVQNVILTSQCSDCEKTMKMITSLINRSQIDMEAQFEYERGDDHTWGGDPDESPPQRHVCFSIFCVVECLVLGNCGNGTIYLDADF